MAQITYKNIYDLITDAKKQGLIPIEISVGQDVQTPNCAFNSILGIYELLQVRDYTITIRLREQQ